MSSPILTSPLVLAPFNFTDLYIPNPSGTELAGFLHQVAFEDPVSALDIRVNSMITKLVSEAKTPRIPILLDQPERVLEKAKAKIAPDRSRKIHALIKALEDDYEEIRSNAVLKLARIDDPRVVAPLIDTLTNDEDPGVRDDAAHVLRRFKDSRVVSALIEALDDDDSGVRASAAESLGIIKDPSAIDPLTVALNDPDGTVSVKAYLALEEINTTVPATQTPSLNPLELQTESPTIETLIQALRDPDEQVADAAAEALGKLRDPRALKPLIKALKYFDEVNEPAARALGQLGSLSVNALGPLLAHSDWRVSDGAILAFKAMGAAAVEPLILLLGNSGQDVRLAVAKLLGEIGDKRAVDSLVAGLGAKSDEQRQTVAEALGKIGDRRAVEALIRSLEDSSEEVRHAASIALGNIGDLRAMEPLRRLLSAPYPKIKAEAARALKKIEAFNLN